MSSKYIGRWLATGFVLATLACAGAAEPATAPDSSGRLAFRVAKVVALDDANRVVNNAVVLVKDGRIEALGSADTLKIPDGYRVMDFPEDWCVPGLVDAHDHAAAGSWGDLNDMVYQTNPGLDSRSIPQVDNDWIKKARAGGVTTVMLLPGSGTNIGGFGTVVSTGGTTPDEITMRTPGSLKLAQSGNPEWYFGGNGRSFMNWNTRQTLKKARAYAQRWQTYENAVSGMAPGGASSRGQNAAPPEFDPIWDGFRGVFRGDYPVTVHTQIYQVVQETINMVHGEFGLWTVLDHSCFDAWKLGPLVRDTDIWTICGPRGFHFDRTANRMVGFAAGWWKNGVRRLGINTDAPVIPQEELCFQGTMACWFGLQPYVGLRGVTSVNAKAIGVYDQVGSVEPGKQADLTIWTGDPLDPRSACLMTVVKGKIVYDGTQGLRRF